MSGKASLWYSKFKDLASSVHGRRRKAGSSLKRAGDQAPGRPSDKEKFFVSPIELRLANGGGEQLWEQDLSSIASYDPEALKARTGSFAATISTVDDMNEAASGSACGDHKEQQQEDDEEHKRQAYAKARRQNRGGGLSFSARLPPDIGSDIAEGVVSLVKQSLDPFRDFRQSMEQVVAEHYWMWPQLEELLYCYLALNPAELHECIKQAFQSVVLDHHV